MQVFDVLDPTFNVRQSFLLEASAGTGKTFSIENIVVRALLEESDEPLSIKDILVVTFTKAAAKELKVRIFQNLQKAASTLTNPEELRRIKRALVEFDHANISTIHAFCYRALAEHATVFRLKKNPEELSQDIVWKVLEKHFHTRLTNDAYSTEQINVLTRRGLVKLSDDIIRNLARGIGFATMKSNCELFAELKLALDSFSGELFEKYAYHYYGLCEGRSKNIKAEFATALKELRESELKKILPLFASDNLKKSVPPPPQEVISYFDKIQQTTVPLLYALCDYDFLLARLSSECQKALFLEFEATETCDFSYLLMKMDQLIESDPAFKTGLKKRYRMAIIDEFQDTDPLQWKMFKELFSTSTFPFILVGDPKQSIYAFRSADIYTYLNAAETVPSQFLLNTNYRSTPELIAALNALFTAVPGWISLPFLKKELSYTPVLAPISKEAGISPAVHFLHVASEEKLECIEERYLFPYFLNEVQNLQKTGIALSKIAFLVRNKKQSNRLLTYFQTKRLPAIQMRSLQLEKALILPDLIHLLRALASPRSLGLVQIALGTVFFRWSTNDFKKLEDQETLGKVLLYFYQWLHIWKTEGVAKTIESILFSLFFSTETIQEGLLKTREGLERYHELRQMVEWLAPLEADDLLTPSSIVEELEAIQFMDQPQHEQMKLRPLVDKDAVQILTLHMSKGLEYEAVFVPGVIVRSPADKGLILAREGEKLVLKAVVPNDPAYAHYLEESDAEKSRQLYVALTRAKSKLYIPVVEGWKPPKIGQASPIELWLARLGEEKCSWLDLYHRLSESRISHIHVLQDQNIVLEKLDARECDPYQTTEKLIELIPPVQSAPQFPKLWNLSFTSLSKNTIRKENLSTAPHDFTCLEKNAHTLPAGAYTGEVLHQILEELPFSIVRAATKSADLKKFIHRYLVKTPFEAWEDIIAEMVFKTFKTPIPELGFALEELTDETCYREMEFIYPLELADAIYECKNMQGTINGVIDLFFTINGVCYLLDWKSNWLKSYDKGFLKQAMLDNRYDLQAELYRKGLAAYLSKISKYPFGGTIYYFLRGNAPYVFKNGVI